ncbi:hypothetical protein [Costertonia aggregata]|uniref:Uncharacterized protein n=1 Tax=Costertonia aggregata TaxID=343403 RepID=A0A7H9AR76_9FLAO|nr:hypothetical protein [Costertonia aggregata]QLG45919.1 hypothetical protein HYG79_11350 [Costertonia aggregata]
MSEQIKKDGKHIGHFVSAVVFFQILPLIPLWFEYQHTSDISIDSLILCSSMYAFATGFSSKYEWQLSICFLTGILLAGTYHSVNLDENGVEIINISAFPLNEAGAFYTILAVFIMHLIERYSRHINGKEPFFLFTKNTKES